MKNNKNNNLINTASTDAEAITVENKTDLTEFNEILNEKTTNNDHDKGRKLIANDGTYTLNNGTYHATITDAFWYKTDDGKDRVMLIFELQDGSIFKKSVDGDWIDRYPFSRLISQADIEYVEDFEGCPVVFKIRNTEGDTMTFSNIKRIALDK